MYSPDYDQFVARAQQGTLVPVYREILADMETPVSAYKKIAHGAEYAFLLESVTGGERVARYSFLGANPRAVLRTRGRHATFIEGDDVRAEDIPEGQDPLDLLKRLVTRYGYCPSDDNPPFTGGAVGYLGYDMVRFFERLPETAVDDLHIDDCCMMIADTLVIFDHVKRKIRVECNTLVEGDPQVAYERAVREIDAVIARLRSPLPPDDAIEPGEPVRFESNMTRERYELAVERCREYIASGDCLQVVMSQRFASPYTARPFDVYRALRTLNPSPYMFYLQLGEETLVGASPEVMVTCVGGTATVRPIAGTRPRGADDASDRLLAEELLADEKERAEHLMLIDLGRNDIGRVSEFGSVAVGELMVVERYSHVMHIVSVVSGTLQRGLDAFDLLRACFPAGTVSGAQKVRAMEIIEEMEPSRRGTYAGAVGYFGYGGDMDTCIAIRTILLQDGVAYVQAGAGIVADSVPRREYEESLNKAKAAMGAVEAASRGLE